MTVAPKLLQDLNGEITESHPLLEALAKLEHDQWMDWAKNLMEKEPAISQARKDRWMTFMVPYDQLDKPAKDMDRVWAAKAVELVQEHYLTLKEIQYTVFLERDMLTKVVDVLQEELKACTNGKCSAEAKLHALEQEFEKLQKIVKDFFAAQLDSNPKLD